MSAIGSGDGVCEAYACSHNTLVDQEVDQDLDTIANLVVRLRSEAQQKHGASKITDLEALDKVLRALAEHFNALSPFEKKPYYDLFAVFQETDLMHIDPLGDDRTLYYNGEKMPKGEWEAMINSLFMQYTDGTWYKGKQLEDFLKALKPYGMHFDPPECKGIDPTSSRTSP